jgi:hypothetical protein
MPSMNERRRTIADYAVPTPQSPNGLYMDLRIALYDTDGHVAISPINCVDGDVVQTVPNDYVLIAELAKLIGQLRTRQRARRNAA